MADSGQVSSQTGGEQPTTEAPTSATEEKGYRLEGYFRVENLVSPRGDRNLATLNPKYLARE